MKKTKLFKHLLACTLVISLTASDIVPAMAAEIQSPETNIETEITAPEETTVTEGTEAESAEGETYNEPAAQVEGDAGEGTETTPVVSGFTVADGYYDDYYDEYYKEGWSLSFSTTDCSNVKLVVKDAAGTEVYTTTYDISSDGSQTKSISWYNLDGGAEEGKEYTFILTPLNGETEGTAVEAKKTVPVVMPKVNKLDVKQGYDGEDYYSRWQLTFNTTDCSYVDLVITDGVGTKIYENSYYVSENGYDQTRDIYWYNLENNGKQVSIVSGMKYTFTLTPRQGSKTGTPAATPWTAPVVPAVTGLAVKEMTPDGFEFTHSVLPEGAEIKYQFSENAAFNPELAEVGELRSDELSYDRLEPGVKYFVRACATMSGIDGVYSNVVNVTAPVAEVININTEINDTDVTLTMNTSYGQYTGFEVYRKSGKKYMKLATTSSRVFTDTGLKKDTKYSYRVRAIYYNINTKKTSYGEYAYVTVETGKVALNVKASAAGKTSIKLTWSKVAGASGYDVYRRTCYSSSRTNKSGEYYNFTKYELVKSLGKKKKTYTDKKLTSGETYFYTVKAYKLVKGKKVYFTEDSDSASTKFDFDTSVNVYKQAQNPKTGKVALAWKQIPQAQGYLIEREDEKTGAWVQQAKLTKASKTSYTLPASPAGKTVEYRIRAYKGTKYTNPTSISVTGSIAVVTGVKATATAEGVKVSWKAVPGAAYYRVFRTMDENATYNADLKTYGYYGIEEVQPEVYVQADAASHWYYTIGKSAVKMREASYNDKDVAAAAAKRALRYQYPADYNGYCEDSYWDNTTNTQIKLGGIKGTSVIDYNYSEHDEELNPNGTVKKDNVTLCGPLEGVTYHYFVVAYTVAQEQKISSAGTPYVSYYKASSYGYSKSASAAFAGAAAIKAPTVKAKAGKKSVTLTISKVAGAKSYAIYRSTKQKGTYELVGITSKTKYKDSKLTSKKKYYYKVKAIGVNSMGTDVVSSFSKVKNAKAK